MQETATAVEVTGTTVEEYYTNSFGTKAFLFVETLAACGKCGIFTMD